MANKLEREAKDKKDARKKQMGKGRTAIEKMDSTLEEIMNEPNLEGKIKELEAELKAAQEVAEEAREKADSVGADKRDRDEKGAAKFAEYKKGIEGSAQEAEAKSKAIAKKLKFYKAFKENGKQILNIRDYQIRLQKRLEGLESEKRVLDQGQKEIEKVNAELKKIEENYKTLMEKRREVEEKLKDTTISREERASLEARRTKISNYIDSNNQKYAEASRKKAEMEAPDMKKISADIASTQITISKCNMVWTSLLKGKNWDEIQAILQTGDFTAKKGTLGKIRDLSKKQEEVILDEIQAQTGRNVSQILEGTSGEIEGSDSQEQGINEEQEHDEEEKGGLPAEIKSFAEEHPRLAKIPFLAKFMDNRAEKKREREEEIAKAKGENNTEEVREEDNAEKENSPREVAEDKDLAYVDKQIGKGRDTEIFKSIADKGIRETVKVDRETQFRLMKVSAAKAQAEKFAKYDRSGRYQEQLREEETRAKEAEDTGREPGDE